ncbi:four helix bundle protein [Fluviicola sp.]|uniref:four helix bundle protein n=1 Tax=Fluviicola sp. TaxID=1917219 RepID=UPI0031D4DEE7
MFDFEKLDVYQKAKQFNKEIYSFLRNSKTIDSVSKNQLRRASLSIMLNIAEGSSIFSEPDRRNFFVISRGSAFECAAVFDFLKEETILTEEEFQQFYAKAEELFRMLFKMIQNLSNN